MTSTNLKTTLTTALATLKALAQADWGPALERTGRGLAIAIAFTYAAGWLLGTWVHQSSSLLARFAAELTEPDWHQQRLAQLKARLKATPVAVRETTVDAPQASSPLIDAPQAAVAQTATEPVVVVRTKRSKLPQPAPKPSRQRRPKNSKRTTAPALT